MVFRFMAASLETNRPTMTFLNVILPQTLQYWMGKIHDVSCFRIMIFASNLNGTASLSKMDTHLGMAPDVI